MVVCALLGIKARLLVTVVVARDDGTMSFTLGSTDRLYGKWKL